jgi:predicted ATPase
VPGDAFPAFARLVFRPGASVPIPTDGSGKSLTARLDRLGSARDVAQIGAVIGRGFSYGLFRAVADLGDAALREALERLAEADILLVQGLPPESEYRFKHALVSWVSRGRARRC